MYVALKTVNLGAWVQIFTRPLTNSLSFTAILNSVPVPVSANMTPPPWVDRGDGVNECTQMPNSAQHRACTVSQLKSWLSCAVSPLCICSFCLLHVSWILIAFFFLIFKSFLFSFAVFIWSYVYFNFILIFEIFFVCSRFFPEFYDLILEFF